jgi:hypothetical protein
MLVLKELFCIPVIRNVCFELYEQAYIPEVDHLKDMIEIPVYELIHAKLVYVVTIRNILSGTGKAP